MLRIIIKGTDIFNQETQTFSTQGDVIVDLEHSLVSLSKWEAKHQKPFLSSDTKTSEEIMDYLKAMVVATNPVCELDVMDRCSQQNIDDIQQYMDSNQSATTFGTMPEKSVAAEVITSELIYYWLVAFAIPHDCENWHLNRLFALVRICNIKNQPKKKISKYQLAMRNRDLNAKRREELGTKG